jgi:hypothetical protein
MRNHDRVFEVVRFPNRSDGETGEMMTSLQQYPDHGLPLVQLKERRRELVIAHRGQTDPPTAHALMEIAAIQHAISAFEDVKGDLDAGPDTSVLNLELALVSNL